MSLSYKEMYNISAGIFYCFNNPRSKKRMFKVNHKEDKLNEMEMFFPYSKYHTSTKEDFVTANLYLNFKKNPSSLHSLFDMLKELEDKEYLKFKNEIINYKKFLYEDIERVNNSQTSIDLDYMTNQYKENKIKWYTWYFYVENKNLRKKVLESIINKKLLQKIDKLMLYISFSDKSKEAINNLMKNRIAI